MRPTGRLLPGRQSIYACICFGLTESEVRGHIRAGASNLDALARACGAGSDCRGCDERLLRLIAEEKKHEGS